MVRGFAGCGLFVGVVFSLVLSSTAEAYEYHRGEDLTAEYLIRYAEADDILPVVRKLREYDVVYVPGFFTNAFRNPDRHLPRSRKTLIGSYRNTEAFSYQPSALGFYRGVKKASQFPGEYLAEKREPFLEWLRRYGISVERVLTNTEGSAEENGAYILERIRSKKKPVLLITRSKGGVDSLHAFVKDPDLFDKKVVKWLSLQSPFLGTPTAELFAENFFLRILTNLLLKLFGGGVIALDEMTRTQAEAFAQAHASKIDYLINKSPTQVLNVASFIRDDRKRWDTIFEPFWRDVHLKRTGLENDGVVPWKTAVLPSADFVLLDEVDHVATTSGGIGPNKIDRKRVIHTLLSLTLDL